MNAGQTEATLDRILIAAECLFAEDGYNGTTLRQITRKARVNLAAVNYHHGDKESLYLEVIRRRIRPINESRLAALAAAEAEAAGQPVPPAILFRILAEPLFALFADPDARGRHTARLIGRCLVEPLPFLEKFLADEFEPVMGRFGQALRRQTPAIPPEDFLWRLSFVIGALFHSLASLHRMKALTRGICRDNDHTVALPRFVEFATDVFGQAPTKRGVD